MLLLHRFFLLLLLFAALMQCNRVNLENLHLAVGDWRIVGWSCQYSQTPGRSKRVNVFVHVTSQYHSYSQMFEILGMQNNPSNLQTKAERYLKSQVRALDQMLRRNQDQDRDQDRDQKPDLRASTLSSKPNDSEGSSGNCQVM